MQLLRTRCKSCDCNWLEIKEQLFMLSTAVLKIIKIILSFSKLQECSESHIKQFFKNFRFKILKCFNYF